MSSAFKITIPKPCDENFDKFEKRPEGGFCGSCHTTVVDFSKMDDQQIRSYFANLNTKVCGRFRPDQLKSYKVPSPIRSQRVSKAAVLCIPLFAFFPFMEAQGQSLPTAPRVEQLETRKATIDSTERNLNISGKIIDASSGESIPFASIVLVGEPYGTSSDIEGNFTFPIPLKKGDQLRVSFVGYQTQSYTIESESELIIKFEMDETLMGDIVIVGEVAVMEPHRSRRSFWEKIKAIF